jgi:hypothetical protein
MYQRLLASISPPLSDDEAGALATLFGPDDCFGLAWTIVHLVESAPGWPAGDNLASVENRWATVLRERAAKRQ